MKTTNELTQQRIKAIHQKDILLRALHSGGISRAELRRQMHLSFPSISALVDELIADGLLTESEPGEASGRGRPCRSLQAVSGSRVIPTVSMEPDGYRCRLCSLCAEVLEEGFLPYALQTDAPFIRPLEEWMAKIRADRSPLALLISVPGNYQGGNLSSSVLKHRPRQGFVDELERSLQLPVFLGNRASYYAYGERNLLRDSPDFIFLYVGDGVGAGIIKDGGIFGNGPERVGEIGHISIDYRGRSCVCGGRGCLERYVSIPALCEDAGMDFPALCREYRDGNAAVTALLEQAARLLAVGISSMLTMQPAELVVLGGEITALGPDFLELLSRCAECCGFRKYMDRLNLRYARSGPDADLEGALWYYLDHILEIRDLL